MTDFNFATISQEEAQFVFNRETDRLVFDGTQANQIRVQRLDTGFTRITNLATGKSIFFPTDEEPRSETGFVFNGFNPATNDTDNIGDNDSDVLLGDQGDSNVDENEFTPIRGTADALDGGAGNDSIFGFEGDDMLLGGLGQDFIQGNQGMDMIDGGNDADRVNGGADNDTISGNDGDDTLFGDAGNDTINGGRGADFVQGNMGADTLGGNDGDDTVLGGMGDDTISGDNGNDRLRGDLGRDTIDGGVGNDEIFGGNDADVIVGGSGNDDIFGGTGADTINGEAGNDTVRGDEGDDTITNSGEGRDFIFGGANDDQIFNLANDSVIDGDEGILGTSSGRDTLVNGSTNINSFSNFTATDRVVLEGSGGDDFIRSFGADNRIAGGTGSDVVDATGRNNTVDGGDGGDFLSVSGRDSTVTGGAGNDDIDTFSNVSGINDGGTTGESDNSTFDGGAGDDVINVRGDDLLVIGGAGNDDIVVEGDVSRVIGGTGEDNIDLTFASNSTVVVRQGDTDVPVRFGLGDTVTNFQAEGSGQDRLELGEAGTISNYRELNNSTVFSDVGSALDAANAVVQANGNVQYVAFRFAAEQDGGEFSGSQGVGIFWDSNNDNRIDESDELIQLFGVDIVQFDAGDIVGATTNGTAGDAAGGFTEPVLVRDADSGVD